MTVMHVLNGASGGAAMSTIALMEGLKKQGICACAVCDDKGTDEERGRLRDAVGGNVVFVPLYWWNQKTRSTAWKRPLLEAMQLIRTGWKLSSTRNIIRAIERWNPQLIHTNTLLTPEGGLAARKVGIPHVWHIRELVGPGLPFQFGLVGQAFGSYLETHCDRIIANSKVTAAQIKPWVSQDFVRVVSNGIDCASFVPKQSRALANPVVIGMVANLSSKWKKHRLFIEAAARVDPSLPVKWRIYGHDPSEGGRVQTDSYTNGLRVLAKTLKIESLLEFPGHLPPEKIMSEIDILVHPADAESFGRVVVEAMAAGVPVVGAGGGGVAEIVIPEETGLLFRPDDSNDLARCIERVIHDGDLARRFAIAGRSRAEQEYGIDNTARKVAEIYHEVLGNRQGREAVNTQVTEGAQIH
jgi:glycosyltransferase involved in cell wall biosynthesis